MEEFNKVIFFEDYNISKETEEDLNMYYFIKKFHWTVEEYKQTDIKDLEVLFTIQNMISKKEQLDLQSNKNK